MDDKGPPKIFKKKKQQLYDKFLKNKINKNHLTYKTYNNLFKQIKNKSKKNYYQNLLIKYRNNLKKHGI